MKRILLFILLLIGTGCKVMQQPASKAESASESSAEMYSERVIHTSTDSLLSQIDSLIITHDSLRSETGVGQINEDSLHLLTDTLLSGNNEILRANRMGTPPDSLSPTDDAIPVPIKTAFATPDSLLATNDGVIPADSLATDSVPQKKGTLEAAVDYEAKDSIVWTADNMAFLYGEGDVKYQNIGLKAETIRMDMDSSLLYAVYGVDSLGDQFGYPVFSEGEQEMEAEEMNYNFKSRKATAKHVVTQQGEGYVTAGITKKMDDDVLNMQGGKYTTCDEHDHPHFYINMTKAKVRPGKDIVTGPAYLVIADVPLFPLVLPFAFFPFTDSYSSGIIMPSYGDEMNRGFFLRDGGYYFALSDYIDLALTGEIYTKGSWGLTGRTSYRKRYKYSGNISLSYLTTITGDKGLDDYSKRKDFSIKISHTQDAKANPYRTISASVDFSSSSYDRNQLNSLYSPAGTQNNKGSSVSISQRFPNKPITISATMNINQRSSDSTVSVTFPDMNISMSRIYPLKRKNASGKERWFEKISLNYNAQLKNSISTKEDKLLQSSLIKDWQNAMQHKASINATYSLLDHINVTPSFDYTERWYTHKIDQQYDHSRRGLTPSDTTYGFYRVYNYSASISAATTLYGTFTPWKPFRKFITTIRHRMDPSISFSATPDFGDPRYGFYQEYSYIDHTGYPGVADTLSYTYSPFAGQLYGVPGQGKSGSITFTLDNNLEAKVPDLNEASGVRKISLIDKLSGSISYNLVADSFNWSDLRTNMRLKLSKSYTLNLNATFDTYTYDYNESTGRVSRVNKPRWTVGKGIGRLRSTGTSFSYTFNNDTFKKWFGGDSDRKNKNDVDTDMMGEDEYDPDDPFQEEDEFAQESNDTRESTRKKKKENDGEYDYDGYYNVTIPWSFSFNYNLSVGYDTQKFDPKKMEYKYKFTHALSFNGNLQPTKNWRVTFNATYDVENKKLSHMTCNISRSMHCFQMSASIIPIGRYKSYSFSISANSSMLKDLKYDQRGSPYDGQSWY